MNNLAHPISFDSQTVHAEFFHNIFANSADFLHKAPQLLALSKKDLNSIEEGGCNWNLVPKIILVEGNYKGKFTTKFLDISGCLDRKFPYEFFANYVLDQATIFGESYLLCGLKFTEKDGYEVYSEPFLFSVDEISTDRGIYYRSCESALLKESGCENLEDAKDYFAALQITSQKQSIKKARKQN